LRLKSVVGEYHLMTFQSLLGFLMRCDRRVFYIKDFMIGFNPCWVF